MEEIIKQLEKVVRDADAILAKQIHLSQQGERAEKALNEYAKVVYHSHKYAEETYKNLQNQLPKSPVRHEYDLGISTKRFLITILVCVVVSVVATLFINDSFDKKTIKNQRIEIDDLRTRLDYLERNSGTKLKEQYRKKFD